MTSHRLTALAFSLAVTTILSTHTGASHAADEPHDDLPVAENATPDSSPNDPNGPADNPAEAAEAAHLPKAKNVALDQPVSSEQTAAPESGDSLQEPSTKEAAAETPATDELAADTPEEQPATGPATTVPADPNAPPDQPTAATRPAAEDQPQPDDPTAPSSEPKREPESSPFVLLGTEVPPGTSTRLSWAPSQSFEGVYSATPVLVVNGAQPGPALCLTAAVHGDELNGVETVRRVLYNLDAQKLKGTVVGVPIVNLQGFHRSSRYLSDRRDLNRYFPGDPQGSSASRIAHSFFHEVIKHCSAVVDLHTGSFYRTNLPQLRGDLRNSQVVKLTESFGSTVVLHSEGTAGTLRRAAVEAGIPAITLEAGAPMVLSEDSVSHSVKGVRTLLNHLDMVSKFRLWGDPEPVYYNSTWQRAPEGGIVFSKVSLGQTVRKGDLLATVTNPITNLRTEIRSSYHGRILGMALNQVVQPGFATHHIGIQAPEEQISEPEDVEASTSDEQDSDALDTAAAATQQADKVAGPESESSDLASSNPGDAGDAQPDSASNPADNAAQTLDSGFAPVGVNEEDLDADEE